MTVDQSGEDGSRQRTLVFCIEVAYLLGLIALVILATTWPAWKASVPTAFGPVPTSVPWFGALGGVITSLRGVFDHRSDWNPDYLFRHLARPLTAAISGTIGYLILIGGVVAVGQAPSIDAAASRAGIVYDVTAFVVGYREEVFRSLLKRVVDKLLRSPSE